MATDMMNTAEGLLPGSQPPPFNMAAPAAPIDIDEQKRVRFSSIVEILSKVSGRVHEEGIERLARKIGMDCFWDEGVGANAARTLLIAGTGFSVDIEFKQGEVQNVAVSFPEASDKVQARASPAGRILFDQLKDDGPKGNGMRDFAMNLRRLAILDKLSVGNEFSCFEALNGLYTSLKKLYDFEYLQTAQTPQSDTAPWMRRPAGIAKIVTMSRSGRPRLNENGTIGLSIDYWTARGDTGDKTWSLVIECEAKSAQAYSPVRVSEDWIFNDIVKTVDLTSGASSTSALLDWQQPPNTILKADTATQQDPNCMEGIETSVQKLPDVRFVAHFDPPLIVPYHIGEQLHHAVGVEYKPGYDLKTFDDLIAPEAETLQEYMRKRAKGGDRTYSAGSSKEDLDRFKAFRCIRRVRHYDKSSLPFSDHPSTDGLRGGLTHKEDEHQNAIYFKAREFSSELKSLPFSHPSQLIEMLPTLRQWARVASMLQQVMVVGPPTADQKTQVEWEEFDEFPSNFNPTLLLQRKQKYEYGDLYLDLQTSTMPTPRFDVQFRSGSRKFQVEIEACWNGELRLVKARILRAEIVPPFSNLINIGGGATVNAANIHGDEWLMIPLLERTGDFEVWADWVKRACAARWDSEGGSYGR